MSVSLPKNLYDCLEHPKTCAPDDFWGQVRRTQNGKPVSEDQINMMFSMIRQGLCLQLSDVLLDIACGNGAIGKEFFDEAGEYLGVDLSPILISIGQKNFQRIPTHIFMESNIETYLLQETRPAKFTKALWHSAFQYFSTATARDILSRLYTHFIGIQCLFIGSIPDRSKADIFFNNGYQEALDDHSTAIGRWYTRQELQNLAVDCGWVIEIVDMPEAFYQAHYRFNALLTRHR